MDLQELLEAELGGLDQLDTILAAMERDLRVGRRAHLVDGNVDQAIADLEADLVELREARGETQALAWLDRQARVIRVSPGFTAVLGYPAAAVLGRSPGELFPSVRRSAAWERYMRQLALGEIHSFTWAGYLATARGDQLFVSCRLSAHRVAGVVVGFVVRFEPLDVCDQVPEPPRSLVASLGRR